MTVNLQVKKVEFTVKQLEEKAKDLDKLASAGNVKETATMVSSIAQVLNEQTNAGEQKSKKDLEESKEVNATTSGLFVLYKKGALYNSSPPPPTTTTLYRREGARWVR